MSVLQHIIAGSLVAIFMVAPFATYAETEAERRTRLEAELGKIEREMLQTQVLVEDKQMERQSLERDVDLLEAEVYKAQLGVQARSRAIALLTDQIGEKEEVISILNERMAKQEQSIAELIRKTQEVDDFSLIELLLSNQNFSEFFEDFESFRSINDSLNNSMAALRDIKADTHLQVNSLEEKQMTEAEMKAAQEREKARIEQQEAEKEQILAVTKGEEQAYQELLESQQKTAAQLRAQLFELLGGGGGIPLPQAVELSQYASGKTGVPASLILAVLEQETNIGSHLGSCAYTDTREGRAVMHPDRDLPVFLAIADALGFNASTRQVSCPIISGGQRVGWGGAMGPSQFIPSTWAIYGGIVNTGGGWTYDANSDVIRRINGNSSPANPFNNRDAFLATALLLRDNGANGTYAGDRLAALRYYAGWGGASNPANAFYGDQVMQRKAKFVDQIRILSEG